MTGNHFIPTKWKKPLAVVILIDGVISATFGHEFMRWLHRYLPPGLRLIPAFFLRVPESLFRLGALLQAVAGARMFLADFK